MPMHAHTSGRLQESAPAPARLPELVRMDEVARALCITDRHVRRLVDERRIPFVKVGYFIRFDPSEVAKWVEAHRVEADQVRRQVVRTPQRMHRQ